MKNKFIKNTLILIIGGFLTKIMGMFIKIIITRNITDKAISLYMLTLPTYNLFITLVTAGLQLSISKLTSENKINRRKILSTSLRISIIISIILEIILIISSKYIAILLHNKSLYYPILSIMLSIPFIGISSIIKGYFQGLNKMHIQVISNFIEQIIRILLFILILPKINNDIIAVTFIVGSNIVNEIASIIVLTLFFPKRKIKIKELFISDKEIKKEILSISIPNTTSKIIGTISYFFEPIILTNLLLINGIKPNYISNEYGIITGYSMQLLLLPSFFSMAISQSLIPIISNAYINKKYTYIKKKIKEILLLSLSIGLLYTSIILIKPEFFLNLIYDTNKGGYYIRIMAPIFIFLYLETPISAILQSMNMSKETMKISIIGILIKNILMIILSFLNFKIYSFIIPMLINILFVSIYNFILLKRKINSF